MCYICKNQWVQQWKVNKKWHWVTFMTKRMKMKWMKMAVVFLLSYEIHVSTTSSERTRMRSAGSSVWLSRVSIILLSCLLCFSLLPCAAAKSLNCKHQEVQITQLECICLFAQVHACLHLMRKTFKGLLLCKWPPSPTPSPAQLPPVPSDLPPARWIGKYSGRRGAEKPSAQISKSLQSIQLWRNMNKCNWWGGCLLRSACVRCVFNRSQVRPTQPTLMPDLEH